MPGLCGAAASSLGEPEQFLRDEGTGVSGDGQAGRQVEFLVQPVAASDQVGFKLCPEIGILLGQLGVKGISVHAVVEEGVVLVAVCKKEIAQTYIAEDVSTCIAGDGDGDIEVCLRGEGRIEFAAQERRLEEVTAAERLGRDERREGEQGEQDGQTVSFHCASSFWRER